MLEGTFCIYRACCTILKYSRRGACHRRLRWLGHAVRMSNDGLPEQMLFGMLAPAARSTKAWSDYVREDTCYLGLSYDWYRQAQIWQAWRNAIHKLLEHT